MSGIPPRNIVFVGSHLGYPMDRTPLGGGAMVGLQLARHWARQTGFRLKVLGSGPESPGPAVDYWSSGPTVADGLVRLSELGYARFCRHFERATTAWLEAHRRDRPPESTCLVLNDISESPDVARLAALGYPMLSIWHVDVVDFFNKMYFHNLFGPERWTRAYDGVSRLRLHWAVPDLLKLVFSKQRQTVLHSGVLAVPSRRMADTLEACYARIDAEYASRGPGPTAVPLARRIEVVPWGCWREEGAEDGVVDEAARLRAHYQLGPGSRVLMTLSRISPEKGIVLLLEALRLLEASGRLPAKDVCLFVCGEPAFMRGEPYYRQVRRAAERLKSVRVFFVGYLSHREKRAYFTLADLFVSPSIHESYGLTIVEAMQAGLPVLASDHSGSEETLLPEYGRVVPYGRQAGGIASWVRRRGDIPQRLAAALSEMLADPAALRAMGAAARDAAGRMSFEGASRKILDAALELAGAGGRPSARAETALGGSRQRT